MINYDEKDMGKRVLGEHLKPQQSIFVDRFGGLTKTA